MQVIAFELVLQLQQQLLDSQTGLLKPSVGGPQLAISGISIFTLPPNSGKCQQYLVESEQSLALPAKKVIWAWSRKIKHLKNQQQPKKSYLYMSYLADHNLQPMMT